MREPRSADYVLDRIVQFTGHSDRQMLNASLVTTLYELIAVDAVVLSHVQYGFGAAERHVELELNPAGFNADGMMSAEGGQPLAELPAFQRCYETRESVAKLLPGGDMHTIHPLMNGRNEVIGFVELYGPRLGEADTQMLAGLLKIYRNFVRLLDDSERDMLTGLLNRRSFDRNFRQLLEADEPSAGAGRNGGERRHQASDRRHWFAVCDIDHFKRINDGYGHVYGDEVLLLFANLMRRGFRGCDRMFRFGGEEFVVILKSATEEDAFKVLERFRHSVEQYAFPQVGQVTVSIGFAEICVNEAPTEVLGKADKALYQAKSSGRNQTLNYEQLVAAGVLASSVVMNDDIEFF